MALPYSSPRAGYIGVDNRIPRRCQCSSDLLDPDDANLLGIARQLIDGLISAATS